MKWWKENDRTAVIKFYGEIYRWWNGAEDFTNTFDELQRQFSTIIIKVHCYGGTVTEGNVIQHAITNSKVEVIIEVDGVAASMGSLFILGAKKIRMAENGFIMIHEPRSAIEGNAKQLFEYANLLKKMTANAVKSYTARSGKKESDFQKYMDGADHWLSADEAKTMGLVDEIIPSVVASVKDISKTDLSVEETFKTVFDRFAANLSDTSSIPNSNNNQKTIQMKEILIVMFGLTGLTKDSSDTAIAEAIKAKFDAQNTKMEALTKASIASVIASAEQKSGKEFSAEQKASLTSIGEKSGMEALGTVMALMQPGTPAAPDAAAPAVAATAPKIVNLISTDGKKAEDDATRATWKYSEWQTKDNDALMKMRTEDQAKYVALYKAEFGFEPDMN